MGKFVIPNELRQGSYLQEESPGIDRGFPNGTSIVFTRRYEPYLRGLKPQLQITFGTAEAVPLSKTTTYYATEAVLFKTTTCGVAEAVLFSKTATCCAAESCSPFKRDRLFPFSYFNFLSSTSIVAGWIKLIRQLQKTK
jgi:hypothetical protein